MKRLSFLTAASAAALASCGGHVVPGVSPAVATQGMRKGPSRAFTFVPAVPDPIPPNILAHPLVGEAYRFSGTAAPQGWVFMQGQTLPISQYRQLFAILGHPIGDKSKTTFTLPNPPTAMIVAFDGVTPGSPQAHAAMRDLSYQHSLGPNARATQPKAPAAPTKAQLEARALLASAIHASPGVPRALSDVESQALDNVRIDAQRTAIGAIDAATANVVRDAVSAVVAGRTTLYGAVVEVAGRISVSEAQTVLAVNDRMQRSLTGVTAISHPNAQREAAHFLVSNAITPEQAAAIAERE